jgi:hypothetical protein
VAISDQVTANMPETIKLLEAASDDYADIVDSKVSAALSEIFPDLPQPVDEGSLNLTPFQERYIGDYATRFVIDAATDYYMVRTGRTDSIVGVPASQDARSQRTSGPGTGRLNYDRVAALNALDARLAARLSADSARFETSFKTGTQDLSAGIMISTMGVEPRTLDPALMPRINQSMWFRNPPFSWSDSTDRDWPGGI